MPPPKVEFESQPLWYKDAIIYQLHVKTLCDSNGDGAGDFKGLTGKLEYLKNLGITAIWLLPFYPSPLKDDGYDISDYHSINPQYGTLRDFKEFLKQAHRYQLRVITELVVNHTSDQHPWFQRARKAPPGSRWRNFYVWNDTPEKYKEARIIFKDFEPSNWTYDDVAKAYYWHRFYSHQPDLNFDNPAVQKEIMRVADYWFEMGVDGVRLDAVPYLFEREGTNCENLPETYDFLKKLRKHVDRKFKDKMLLAEANQWPEDAVAYFGGGEACHMAFHFPLMPRMYMSLQMEDRYPIVDIMEQTPAIPENCQWAVFLRNHDELTLEMVTDEERDYMYRMYAKDKRAKINMGIRRRLVPLLGNDRKKVELMNVLLCSLPGTPIIYYGDEIGMGDNYYLGDRDGVRTPMQWSPDRNAGFSKVNPQQLYLPVIIDPEYHYETVNVETQERNLSSLLWWMRRVLDMRKRFKAFSRGWLQFLLPENPRILSFIRQYDDEIILVVINLSRFSQSVELDLSAYVGYVPEEVFSQNKFPQIREVPYNITLGPHNHYWLLLKPEDRASVEGGRESERPPIKVETAWQEILFQPALKTLEQDVLPRYLATCRWFGGKSQTIHRLRVAESFPMDGTYFVILEVAYRGGGSERYFCPLAFAEGELAARLLAESPASIIAPLHVADKEGVLYDAVYNEDVQRLLLNWISRRKKIHHTGGDLVAVPGKRLRAMLAGKAGGISSRILKAEQSNTSVIYNETFFLKIYRKLEEGVNPDAEIVSYLTAKNFAFVPPFAGSIEYRRPQEEPIQICLMQGLVENQGDAWTYTLNHMNQYFEKVLSRNTQGLEAPELPGSLMDIDINNIPEIVHELVGSYYLEMIKILGQRTGEMHRQLGSDVDNPNFVPEPFSLLYQKSVYQSMSVLTRRVVGMLRKNTGKIRRGTKSAARHVMAHEKAILEGLRRIVRKKISAQKIRIHGDYHLGQVLYTGKDFIIIDFEGEPARAISERRLKRSALRDVAGMIRSFHYASFAPILLRGGAYRKDDLPVLEQWADIWYQCVAALFLNVYVQTVQGTALVPDDRREFDLLLQIFLLEKSVYELGYELNNRPEWVGIPLKGIQHTLHHLEEITL